MGTEEEQLKGYRDRLQDGEARLDAVTREVEGLRQVVAGLEAISAARSASTGTSAARGDAVVGGKALSAAAPMPQETPRQSSATQGDDGQPEQRRRAPRGLPTVLREILADGQERSVEQIEQQVINHEKFREFPPQRRSISNRLHEMAEKGEFERTGRGTYKLAREPVPNGSAPAHEIPAEQRAEPTPAYIQSQSPYEGGS